jgi:lactose/cellobiose-specific phosphotransferase system IIC component
MTRPRAFFKRTDFWLKLSRSRHLEIIRDSLTLAFPVVIAGALAVLINGFPLARYHALMEGVFGGRWHNFGRYVWDGTLAVLAPVTVCTIGYGVCELYNSKHRLNAAHPLIVGLISLCSLMAIIEPSSGVAAIPYEWMGIHGLFLAIIVAVASSELFLLLWSRNLRGRFFAEASSSVMNSAFSSLLPGTVTIFAFAAFKAVMGHAGYSDIHRLSYDLICKPFVGMGNNLFSSIAFGVSRQILWFLGIHGSNALEPVMTELYSGASASASGRFVFTKTFFDCYATMGGAGNTLSLVLALIIARRGKKIGTVTKISILPAMFNINETLVFGVPIVLNPVFLAPFILTPPILTVTGYAAIASGLVTVSGAEVDWITPVFMSGYTASGNMSGVLLQLFNLALGAAIYLPFVKVSDKVQGVKFSATYKELVELSYSLDNLAGPSLTLRNDDIGALSRLLAGDLMSAIKKGEFFLEYQPQIDCRNGRVYGVEALLRWKHPVLGRVPPSLFIPLAEEVGYINAIGLWVCGESCRQMHEWNTAGVSDVIMSFNVSVKQLDDPDLPEKIGDLLRRWDVDPSVMKVEVTESTGLSSNMGHNVILQDLKRSGLSIAIDDFGMGHTSLVYLKEFPVSMIKLDGSLVKDITSSNVSREIVLTISELCNSMDIQLLAEFVETEEQARMLKRLGCCVFQGYLYSPAVDAARCAQIIRQGFEPLR